MQNGSSKSRKWVAASITAIFLGVSLIPKANAAEQTTEKTLSAKKNDEKLWMIDYMASREVTSFLLMDKKSGTLFAIKDREVVLNIPAISSKDKGDTITIGNATPAGIWPLTISRDQSAYDAGLLFLDGNEYELGHSLVIHRAAESRNAFLKSSNPAVRRRSAGCIALLNAPEGYDRISNFVQNMPATELKDSGISGRFLVILPEKTGARAYFEAKETISPQNN